MRQESGPCMSMLCLPVPPLPPQTPNYLWGVCLCRCLQAQSPLMTPCPGRGPPLRSCGYFFHCVRPWGPALLLVCLPPGWLAGRGARCNAAITAPAIMCSPFRGSRGFQPEGEFGDGETCPWRGGEGRAHPLDHLEGIHRKVQEWSPAKPSPVTTPSARHSPDISTLMMKVLPHGWGRSDPWWSHERPACLCACVCDDVPLSTCARKVRAWTGGVQRPG